MGPGRSPRDELSRLGAEQLCRPGEPRGEAAQAVVGAVGVEVGRIDPGQRRRLVVAVEAGPGRGDTR